MKKWFENIVEVHKNGINAHNSAISYYVFDYQTKKVVSGNMERELQAIKFADDYVVKTYGGGKVILMW